MKKEMIVEIEDKFYKSVDEIDCSVFESIGAYVKILACLCEKNNIDLQIDIYGNSNNNTTISYDYFYGEDEDDE